MSRKGKAALTAMLVAHLGQALAVDSRWVTVFENAALARVDKIDVLSAKRNRDVVTVWMLTNFKEPSGEVRSHKALREFDCEAKRTRGLYVAEFRGADGIGALITSQQNDAAAWTPVVPDSSGEQAMVFACKVAKS